MEQKSKKTRVIRSRVDKGWYFKDINGFTPAQQNMIVEWWPYAMKYYTSYSEKYKEVPSDVFYDAITEALMFCVITFKPDRGANFKTWFFTGARYQVGKHVRRWRIATERIATSKDKEIPMTREREGVRERIEDQEWFGCTRWEDDVCSKIVVDEMLAQLTTEKQKDVVTRVYLYGEKPADVARSYGVSRQAIGVVLNGAYKTIRKYLGCDSLEGRSNIGKQSKVED